MIKETDVFCAEPQCRTNQALRFCNLIIFQRRPRQRVSAINIFPDRVFSGRIFVSSVLFNIVVGVEECQLTIVKRPIQLADLANPLNQFVLSGGLFVPTVYFV